MLPVRLRLLGRLLRIFFALLYHQMAWTYDFVAAFVSLGQWKSWVLSALPYLEGPRVLEIGHGPGHLQKALKEKNVHTFGLDASPQMGRLARQRLSRAGITSCLARGLAQAMPFPAGTFHQVVATFPSEYIADPHTLSEIKRILTPGGKAVVLLLAWITGRRPLERGLAWLFRITGQAPHWEDRYLEPLRQSGWIVCAERTRLESSELLIIMLEKPFAS